MPKALKTLRSKFTMVIIKPPIIKSINTTLKVLIENI